jgi:hypothetical protein
MTTSLARALLGARAAALATTLIAVLIVLLLAAPPGGAAGGDAEELASQAVALAAETAGLEERLQDRLTDAYAIDPYGEHAADALPLFAESLGILGEMTLRMETYASLWAKVASLDLDPAATAYAEQQYYLAQDYLGYNGVTTQLLAQYLTLYDAERRERLSGKEVRELEQETADLQTRNAELYEQVVRRDEASVKYFQEHDIELSAGAGLWWAGRAVSLGVASACAVACGVIARRKNRNAILWGVLGFLIPLVAVIVVLVIRPVDVEIQAAPLAQPPR